MRISEQRSSVNEKVVSLTPRSTRAPSSNPEYSHAVVSTAVKSALDVALEAQSIVTLEFIGGPMNGRRVLAPSSSRRLYFDGFDGDARIGQRPLLTAGPAVSLRHLGRYDAEFAYDCKRTSELVLRMRWTTREDDR